MRIDYNVEPFWITRIIDVTHKGKRRNFPGSLHAHKPGTYEIVYVDYGTLTLKFGGSEIISSPGECIFIPPTLEHGVHS